MEEFSRSAQAASRTVTQTFSTSFSSAITLFPKAIQQDIYNIYGLVRVADEVVDSYQGPDAAAILDELEREVYQSLKRGFSANLIVHAFVLTARQYSIGKDLIKPFFASMRMDLTQKTFSTKQYRNYIYGSAEVVGLMCLKVFVDGDNQQYIKLRPGATALGAAFQKVNFLRDIKDDYQQRGRYYFPIGSFASFNDSTKQKIITDIEKDFTVASKAISQLPETARFATQLAYDYYSQLLKLLKQTPAQTITTQRLSVHKLSKLKLAFKAKLRRHGS